MDAASACPVTWWRGGTRPAIGGSDAGDGLVNWTSTERTWEITPRTPVTPVSADILPVSRSRGFSNKPIGLKLQRHSNLASTP